MAAGGQCAWCPEENPDIFPDDLFRCDLHENLLRNKCEPSKIVRPVHNLTLVKNLDLANAEKGKDPVQLAPQEIHVSLRPNTPFKFKVSYRQAENYPVDLYYVMDLSYSMGDDKAKLAELGDLLAARMGNITTNFRLGFGSFVDKKTMPYVSTVPEKLVEPCTGCAAPYGFHNQLPLSDDKSLFRKKVEAAPISGNLDAPEGGFDAIMQAIACKDEIGWRTNSRKILLYSTDAAFHFAGDGKLGGIVDPNDGHCHLDQEGFYSYSLYQDYPSISQIAKIIAEKKVNVIFAVTKAQLGVYESLSKFIEGSAYGELAADSRNIVELVQKNYDLISSAIELKTEGNENVDVKFRSKCKGQDFEETSRCEGLGIGEQVEYEVTLEVKSCPKNRDEWKSAFDIYPVGLTEKLRVNLDLMCECDCEKQGQGIANSPRCNNTGTYACGACKCSGDFYGKHCECDGSTADSEDYEASCRMPNSTKVCENHGECQCGTCDCFPVLTNDPSIRWSGPFCECDDHSCDRHNKLLCGGPERGVCNCGVCECNPKYKGTACECKISTEDCMAKKPNIRGERLLCNGKGTCHCGKCECNLDDYYSGPTCEDCPSCEGNCEANEACVQCMAFESGPLTQEDCKANCTHVELVNEIEEGRSDWRYCQGEDDDDCMFYFAYQFDDNHVYAQKTKVCPEPVNILAIVLGVILGIVLIGLALLLIWKLFMTIHDRREFAKFEKERQNAKWDTGENPIYKQATSTFKNPTYAGKS